MSRVVAVLCAVQAVDVLGVTLTTTALPAILAGLDAPASAATPVVAAYAMTFGGLLLLGARLGDRVGHRRLLLVALGLHAAASALGVLAPGVAVVVAARALQGVAAALSVPPALALLLAATPAEGDRRGALAAWSAAGAAAGAAGFLAGGVLTDALGWRAGFALGVAAAAVLLPAVARATATVAPGALAPYEAPSTGMAPTAGASGAPLDVLGGVLLTGSAMAAVLGAALLEDGGTRAAGGGLLLVGAGLAVLFAGQQRRAAHPLLPPAALRHPHLRAGVAGSALVTATSSPAMTLLALELQRADGVGAAATGLRLVPFSAAVVAGAALAGRALRRRPRATVVAAGLAALAAGAAALVLAGTAATLPAVVLMGLGVGGASVAATAAGTDVPARLLGTASGTLNTAAQLGTALGTAVVLLLAQATSATAGWAAVAVLGLTGTAAALRPGPARAGRRVASRA